MPSKTTRYERKVQRSLTEYFQHLGRNPEVESQWTAFKGEAVSKYSPRVDVAVGPFAYGAKRYVSEYNGLTRASKKFLSNLLGSFKENANGFSFKHNIPDDCRMFNSINGNARCFMAIEIEKSGTRKHRLGDIVNACSLGRIGLIIAWDKGTLKSFLKIAEYFAFLKGVQKPTYGTRNLIVVSKKQFDTCIKEFST